MELMICEGSQFLKKELEEDERFYVGRNPLHIRMHSPGPTTSFSPLHSRLQKGKMLNSHRYLTEFSSGTKLVGFWNKIKSSHILE
jgi:hypothetical protein